ncbi:YndM family protein [Saliterribacillus persicus]|uniref:Uncharacterized protein DUF2512 n=1 Tax=Saliterribacillus persicus TaxID=930114 RepID=A0A368XA92_9BACI|nr:YndM family protein [Saliterribacillus persicus]RCW63928.1 uncharacterized protein DUF2512 [Saliterribacillus persicus]
MKYITAFIIKFVMITAVLWVVFSLFYGVNFGDVLLISIILTPIAFAADVFVMPKIGNVFAVIGDFALCFLAIWFIGASIFDGMFPLLTAAFLAALVISVGELIYHRYLRNKVYTNVDSSSNYGHTVNFQTEVSEELEPDIRKRKK